MSRFQALTNPVLDAELDLLRERLALEPNQKAELLREVAAIAGWVVRQAEQGRVIEAHHGKEVERLRHPALERLQAARRRPAGDRLTLGAEETQRLVAILEGGFDPPPALRAALANLAQPHREPPALRWPPAA